MYKISVVDKKLALTRLKRWCTLNDIEWVIDTRCLMSLLGDFEQSADNDDCSPFDLQLEFRQYGFAKKYVEASLYNIFGCDERVICA